MPFYITELDLGLDGNGPHNFILINGTIQKYHLSMEPFAQRNWTKQYQWLNGTNSNYLSNRHFQKNKETTFVINTSTAKLKIQFSSSPEITNVRGPFSSSKIVSFLLLGATQQSIYNIPNHSRKRCNLPFRK